MQVCLSLSTPHHRRPWVCRRPCLAALANPVHKVHFLTFAGSRFALLFTMSDAFISSLVYKKPLKVGLSLVSGRKYSTAYAFQYNVIFAPQVCLMRYPDINGL